MSPKQTQYTEQINVFFSPEQLEKIKANAYNMGINVSAYIRMVVVEKINQSANAIDSHNRLIAYDSFRE